MAQPFVRSLSLLVLSAVPLAAQAPAGDPWAALLRPRTHVARPTVAAITAGDLATRLYPFADDSMKGRLLGAQGNARGVEYIAREVQRLGLKPAGDDGTYFQAVPVFARTYDAASTFGVDGTAFTAWTDFAPRDQGRAQRSMDGAQVVFGGTWGDPASLIPAAAAEGKVVVLRVVPAGFSAGTPGTANRTAATMRFRNAAGIVVAGMDLLPAATMRAYQTPSEELRTDQEVPALPSWSYVTRRAAGLLLGMDVDSAQPGAAGRRVSGTPRFADRPLAFPARNVVAVLPGRDPALRGEYVAIGAHNDHIGTTPRPVAHDSIYIYNHLFREEGADSDRPTLTPEQVKQLNDAIADVRRRSGGASARMDSVFNGADDDGSGSMSVLEIAQWFASRPVKPRRSLLFVWHVGEEEGLYGSEHFTDHPTVPRDSIVAQLNIDMIGRGGAADVTGSSKAGEHLHGGPGYVQLVGSRRVSTELGDLAESVNASGHHGLRFDYSMDANGHPQNIYCRSDHYNYARYAIPIIFFTTGGHADYHQVTDEPQYIDYDRMAQVANLVADLAAHVGNLDHRPVVDHPKPDPHGECVQ